MLRVVLYVWHAAVATLVAQRNASPAYFAACSLPTAFFRARVSPLGSSKSLLVPLWQKEESLFFVFTICCCMLALLHPWRVKLCCHRSCFGLLQPCSLAANHTSLQTSHFSPPKKQQQHIYTPPTTETVHLSRLMRVHYNCCPFHKPASGVTHFLELVYNTVSLKKKYNQTDTQYNYAWFFEEQSCTYLVKNVCKPNRYQLCCQYPWPTIAVNISQWCLVRSQTSAGTHRFFVCLFVYHLE